MKYYDYAKAKKFIADNIEKIKSASLGMNEDWFWTGQAIYDNGKFVLPLPDNADEMEQEYRAKRKSGMSVLSDEANNYDHQIGGIYGSSWATPTLQVEYIDGTEDKFECSKGEFTMDITDRIEKEMSVTENHGCLSAPCQSEREDVVKKL